MNFNSNYRSQGAWTWNDELFTSKITEGLSEECWLEHEFSSTRNGPLFGARIVESTGHSYRQMTQARRIQAMRHFGDIVGQQVTHTCGNKLCLNPQHFELKPSRRWRCQG